MKKIVASVGLVALGASGINAVHAQDLSAPPAKPWNVTASLRGFYDDNLNTVPSPGSSDKVFGVAISPGASLNWGNDQTSVKAGYIYGFNYYDHTPVGQTQRYDQNHNFDLTLRHAFNERYQASVGDSFAVGQEPDLLRSSVSGTTFVPIRVSGDNYRNYGTVIFNAQLTPLFGAELGYANEWTKYADHGGTPPSRAGLMDRIGQTAHLNGLWQMTPQTVGVLGYEFGVDDYTGDEVIGPLATAPFVIRSDNRNSFHNKGYVGLNHTFLPELSGTVQGGASVYDYNKNVGTGSKTKVSPYVKADLNYNYMVESHANVGVNYDRSPTDILSPSGDGFTKDAQDLVAYASIYQRIVPNLFGSVIGTIQNSTFNGGQFNNKNEMLYMVGVDLTYHFNTHFSANIGYNFDKLDSGSNSTGRKYDRDRFYVGVIATF